MKTMLFLASAIFFTLWQVPLASCYDLRQFQNMVVFGDSLSDNGNDYAVGGAEGISAITGLPASLYETGRFTNGNNWVDDFTQLAGFPTAEAYLANPKSSLGTDFAFGGATAESGSSFNLAQETALYLTSSGGRASSNSLFFIWIGADDFLSSNPDPAATVKSIENGTGVLTLAGAKSFVLMNVPDISLTPDIISSGPAKVSAAHQFVSTVNTDLLDQIPAFAAQERVKVDLVDINALFVDLVQDPAKYGFKYSSGSPYNKSTGTLASDPNDYVFWDGFHPTQNAHLLAAQDIYSSIIPEPSILWLFGLGIACYVWIAGRPLLRAD